MQDYDKPRFISRGFFFSCLVIFGIVELILIAAVAVLALFFVGLPYLESMNQMQANNTEANRVALASIGD